jgi:hypothetical protein
VHGKKCTRRRVTATFLQCTGGVIENHFQGHERKGIKKSSSGAEPEEPKSGLTIPKSLLAFHQAEHEILTAGLLSALFILFGMKLRLPDNLIQCTLIFLSRILVPVAEYDDPEFFSFSFHGVG